MSFFNNPFKQDTYHYFGKDKVDFKHLLKDHGYRSFSICVNARQAAGENSYSVSPESTCPCATVSRLAPKFVAGEGCTLDTLTESRSAPGRCLG